MKWLDYRLQWERTRRVLPYVAPGARVLDIACADGALFRVLDDRLTAGVGIDLDPVPPSTAKYRYVRGSFPSAMPPGEPFDVVAALAVVEHIPEAGVDPAARLRRLPRRLSRELHASRAATGGEQRSLRPLPNHGLPGADGSPVRDAAAARVAAPAAHLGRQPRHHRGRCSRAERVA